MILLIWFCQLTIERKWWILFTTWSSTLVSHSAHYSQTAFRFDTEYMHVITFFEAYIHIAENRWSFCWVCFQLVSMSFRTATCPFITQSELWSPIRTGDMLQYNTMWYINKSECLPLDWHFRPALYKILHPYWVVLNNNWQFRLITVDHQLSSLHVH